MRNLDIDFDWMRDNKGYRIAPAERRKRPKPGEPSNLLGDLGRPERIVPHGGAPVTYRPLDRSDSLYQIFANIKTADDALAFVNTYGPLTEAGHQQNYGDVLAVILDHARAMNGVLAGSSHGRAALGEVVGAEGLQLSSLAVTLRPDPPTGGIRLVFSPKNLLDALWLQLGQALSGGASIRQCKHCGRWFEIGPGTGRRLDAKFCSDEHRISYNSHQRTARRA
jgi:hypothetical protein